MSRVLGPQKRKTLIIGIIKWSAELFPCIRVIFRGPWRDHMTIAIHNPIRTILRNKTGVICQVTDALIDNWCLIKSKRAINTAEEKRVAEILKRICFGTDSTRQKYSVCIYKRRIGFSTNRSIDFSLSFSHTLSGSEYLILQRNSYLLVPGFVFCRLLTSSFFFLRYHAWCTLRGWYLVPLLIDLTVTC